MAATIVTGYANAPLKQGEPPDHGFLYTGKGLEFDGVSDYITVPHTQDHNPEDESFTVAFWYNTTLTNSIGGAGNNYIIEKYYSGQRWYINHHSGNKLNVRFTSDTFDETFRSSQAYNDGEWHRVVAVVEQGVKIKLYIDGSLDASSSSTWSGNLDSNQRDLGIGARASSIGVAPFEGKLSDMQIWKGVAWSESDVQYDYTHPEKLASNNSGTSLTESNLKLWLPMNEGNPRSPQSTVYDAVMPTTGIKDKNHGTTVFYGDMSDLLTADQKTAMDAILESDDNNFDFTDTDDNAVTGTNKFQVVAGTATCSGNTCKMLNDGTTVAHIYLPFTTVVGRTYNSDVKLTTANEAAAIHISRDTTYNSTGSVTDAGTSSGEIMSVSTFLANGTTSYLHIRNTGGGNNQYNLIDNVKIREVGVAQGWTEADQQLDIPQTALMGGSRKMLFDGVDDYVSFSTQTFTGQFTVAFWINGDLATNYTNIVSNDSGTNNVRVWSTPDGIIRMKIDNANSATITGISDDTWTHCVFTRDGDDLVVGYKDGAQVGATTTTSGDYVITRIGHSSSSFPGYIDEVSIFTTALTLAEVQEMFNDGIPLDATAHTQASNLTGYWRNNKLTTAGTWEDLSTNSNHGTVTGGTADDPIDYVFFQSGLQSGRDSQGMVETHPQVGGGVLSFDGVGDYIDLGRTLTYANDFSLEWWQKYPGGNWLPICGIDSTDSVQWKDANTILVRIDDDPGDEITVPSSAGEWHHFVLVRSSDVLNIYRDGVDVEDPKTAAGNFEVRYIGSDYLAGFFDGELDGVRIYDKALTPEEVTKNHNGSKGRHKN